MPARQRAALAGAARALASHRGWDPGSRRLALELARAFAAPLVGCTTTRLLIDLNRSLEHPRLFSEWTRELPSAEREALIARWWQPHRDALAALIVARRSEPVLHLSVHSFTPRWPAGRGPARQVDVGLLYDPARSRERAFVTAWMKALAACDPALRIRRNQPYRGTSDGLTTAFRTRYSASRYLGIELEVSQRFPLGPPARWLRLRRDLAASLGTALAER